MFGIKIWFNNVQKKKKNNNNNEGLSWKAIQKKWTIKPAIWRRETFIDFTLKVVLHPCKHCLPNLNTILILCSYATIYFTPHYATWNRERNFFCGRDWGHFCLSLLLLDLLLLLLLTFDALLDGIDKFTVNNFGSFILVPFLTTCLTWKKKRSQTLT